MSGLPRVRVRGRRRPVAQDGTPAGAAGGPTVGAPGAHPAIRVGRWSGSGDVAHLVVVPDRPLPSRRDLDALCDHLAARGFTEVVTSALAPEERAPFVAAGFDERSRLTLLVHDLRELPPASSPARRRAHRLRRGRRADRPAMLAVDGAAFPPFWHLGEDGLDGALSATHAVRVTVTGDPLDGFAVSGRSGRTGYLQRLAVHPSAQRRGRGRELVVDALSWMRRHGCTSGLVNTEDANHGALHLYRSLGFVPRTEGLVVLGRTLTRP